MSWTVEEKQRCTDEQTIYATVWANDHHWRANHSILQGKNDFSVQLDNSSRRLTFRGGIIQFWTTTNQQRPESTFEYREKARNRYRFEELTFTVNHNIPFCSSGLIFFVSNSYLIVISERFSYHPDGNFRLSWDFFDQGKRLLEDSRVQSRLRGTRTKPNTPVSCETGHSFRGTRTMPYAYWGSECQSERAPAWRENAFWILCLGQQIEWERDRSATGS